MSTITPNDPAVIYSPYTWDVSAARAKSINCGAYLRIAFTGDPTGLAATFDMTNQPVGKTRITYRVDQGPWTKTQCAASVALTVPGDSWGSHTVELVIRSQAAPGNRWTSPQPTALVFTGLTAAGTITGRAGRLRPLRGLLIGDSQGEGIGTYSNVSGGYEDNHDSMLGWAYPLGDALGAEVGVVAFSGAAYSDSTSSQGVPKAPDSVPFLWEGQARDIGGAPPDFVVINLGENDSIHANPDATVTADATALLNWLIPRTGTAPIVLVPSWRARKASAIQAAAAGCSNTARVHYVDTTGWFNAVDSGDTLHPYGYVNIVDLVPRLAAAVKTHLDGRNAGSRFVNVDGVAVPI